LPLEAITSYIAPSFKNSPQKSVGEHVGNIQGFGQSGTMKISEEMLLKLIKAHVTC
jgi:hypothetical protein